MSNRGRSVRAASKRRHGSAFVTVVPRGTDRNDCHIRRRGIRRHGSNRNREAWIEVPVQVIRRIPARIGNHERVADPECGHVLMDVSVTPDSGLMALDEPIQVTGISRHPVVVTPFRRQAPHRRRVVGDDDGGTVERHRQPPIQPGDRLPVQCGGIERPELPVAVGSHPDAAEIVLSPGISIPDAEVGIASDHPQVVSGEQPEIGPERTPDQPYIADDRLLALQERDAVFGGGDPGLADGGVDLAVEKLVISKNADDWATEEFRGAATSPGTALGVDVPGQHDDVGVHARGRKQPEFQMQVGI